MELPDGWVDHCTDELVRFIDPVGDRILVISSYRLGASTTVADVVAADRQRYIDRGWRFERVELGGDRVMTVGEGDDKIIAYVGVGPSILLVDFAVLGGIEAVDRDVFAGLVASITSR